MTGWLDDGGNYPVTDQLDYARGAICDRCERPFDLGEPYATVLEAMVGDSPVGVSVCLRCLGEQQDTGQEQQP